MYMFPLFLLVVYLAARANAVYHPHLLFKRYIVIQNETVSKLLIGQSDPVNTHTKNSRANRNKLTYAGIVFYGFFLVLCCFSVIMVLLPDLPCESFAFASRYMFLTGDTLNQKLPFIFALTLLFFEAAFYFINTARYAVEKTTAKRFTRLLYCLFSILFSAGAIGGLWAAISTILAAV